MWVPSVTTVSCGPGATTSNRARKPGEQPWMSPMAIVRPPASGFATWAPFVSRSDVMGRTGVTLQPGQSADRNSVRPVWCLGDLAFLVHGVEALPRALVHPRSVVRTDH